MRDVERVDRDRVLRVGVDDDEPVFDGLEVADRVDEVALAVHQDQRRAGPPDVLHDHRVQQGGLASARRRQNPVPGKPGLVGKNERQLLVEQPEQRSIPEIRVYDLPR